MPDSNTKALHISFAGLICFWKIPHQPEESKRQRFVSVYDDLKKSVEQRAIQAGDGERKWRLVRISAPGRHSWGFARR